AASRISDFVPHVPKPHSYARRQVPGDSTRLSGIRTQRRPFTRRIPLYAYTHAHLSQMVEALLEKLGITRFAMYVMDFGGPIGYRLMLKHPDRVTGVVVQNTPAFGEPIGGPL
ncbi:MAG: alpha/beta fold hydrolase, partial [Pseudolabrys sp.]